MELQPFWASLRDILKEYDALNVEPVVGLDDILLCIEANTPNHAHANVENGHGRIELVLTRCSFTFGVYYAFGVLSIINLIDCLLDRSIEYHGIYVLAVKSGLHEALPSQLAFNSATNRRVATTEYYTTARSEREKWKRLSSKLRIESIDDCILGPIYFDRS